jgi:hypothetical protein
VIGGVETQQDKGPVMATKRRTSTWSTWTIVLVVLLLIVVLGVMYLAR